jgi:hypothetical protein|tara:strand:- start:652 stop:855 length:204 start_codon:yes stop_codon:yes gene_type:complete
MTHNVCPIENLFEQAFAIHGDDGPQGVIDAVNNNELYCSHWACCAACEMETPFAYGACLVCSEEGGQ